MCSRQQAGGAPAEDADVAAQVLHRVVQVPVLQQHRLVLVLDRQQLTQAGAQHHCLRLQRVVRVQVRAVRVGQRRQRARQLRVLLCERGLQLLHLRTQLGGLGSAGVLRGLCGRPAALVDVAAQLVALLLQQQPSCRKQQQQQQVSTG
jgi:hypothetical protein